MVGDALFREGYLPVMECDGERPYVANSSDRT